MPKAPTWKPWTGHGYPTALPLSSVYFYPGTVDLESSEELNRLTEALVERGAFDSAYTAEGALENAVVVHGEVLNIDGKQYCQFGPTNPRDEGIRHITSEATWVEISGGNS